MESFESHRLQTLNLNVRNFIDNILDINECDYGDFMRPANTYLNKLIEDCHRQGIRDADKKLTEMKLYLQFAPNWDVESTRKKILKDSIYIDDFFKAHRQDWGSVVTEVPLGPKAS
jgi:hypothetical protein